jgi:hypothetical protein
MGLRFVFPGRGVNHPLPNSTEVKERIELHLYSPSGLTFLWKPFMFWRLVLNTKKKDQNKRTVDFPWKGKDATSKPNEGTVNRSLQRLQHPVCGRSHVSSINPISVHRPPVNAPLKNRKCNVSGQLVTLIANGTVGITTCSKTNEVQNRHKRCVSDCTNVRLTRFVDT